MYAEMTLQEASRRALRKQEIRSRILDASIALITEKGFDKTTIDDICQEAGVARKTLYRYFETKQDIIDELSQSLLIDDLINKTYLALESSDTARARLHALFDMVRQPFYPENQGQKALFVQLIHEITPAGEQGNSEHLQQLNDAFLNFFANCQECGEIRPGIDIQFYAELAVGMIIGIVYNWMGNEHYPALTRTDQLEQMLADTVLCP